MSETNLAAPHGSVFDLKECPYCKGETGFYYRITIKGTQFRGWTCEDVYNHFEGDVTGTKHGAYRCADCNRIIKQNGEGRDG